MDSQRFDFPSDKEEHGGGLGLVSALLEVSYHPLSKVAFTRIYWLLSSQSNLKERKLETGMWCRKAGV